VTREVVVVGAGGMGRETVDVARAAGVRVVGVVDDRASVVDLGRLARLDVPFLGSVDSWLAHDGTTPWVVGIGAPEVRRRLAGRLATAPARPAALVHPAATVGSDSHVGPGSVVCAGALVSTGVRAGSHVHVGPGATIGHDAELADFVSVNPGALVSGSVRIGRGVLVGAGAVVLQGLSVGADSVVGASACVVRDVAESVVVRGVPAR